MKYKTYTFRAYPNKTQANLIYLTFTMCRYMFNTLLRIVLDNFTFFANDNNIFEKEVKCKNGKSY